MPRQPQKQGNIIFSQQPARDTQQSLSLVVFLPMTCQLMEMKASAKFQGPNRTATENGTCLHRPGSSLASAPTKSLSTANWQNGCGRTPAQPWQHTTHKATHCQSNFMGPKPKNHVWFHKPKVRWSGSTWQTMRKPTAQESVSDWRIGTKWDEKENK